MKIPNLPTTLSRFPNRPIPKRPIALVVALIISGIIVSLILSTGNPDVLAAGFLTSTTDADGNAHKVKFMYIL